MERWRDIPGWEDIYQVSDLGRVRSLNRIDRLGRRLKGKVLADCALRNGYRLVTFCVDNVRKGRTVHSLVMEAFYGPPPPGMECCHDDGIRTNNRLSNLRYDTHAGNLQDRKQHGTVICGETHHNVKLTTAKVRQARELVREGATRCEVGRQLNVHPGTIGRIVSRKTWSHVT